MELTSRVTDLSQKKNFMKTTSSLLKIPETMQTFCLHVRIADLVQKRKMYHIMTNDITQQVIQITTYWEVRKGREYKTENRHKKKKKL